MNVAEFFVNIVQRLGADRIFSLTGGMAMHINRAAGASRLRMVYGNHEQACVAAADGYARMHEHQVPGIAVVTSGPGVTNSMTSLASAYHDSVPLVLIAGQVKSADINPFGVRSYGAQEVPSLELVKPLVKDLLRYVPGKTDDNRLAEFFSAALSGRKGPVFVEIPLDMQPVAVDRAEQRLDELLRAISGLRNDNASLDEKQQTFIREALQQAARPVLYLGNGNRIAGVSRRQLTTLAESLRCPVLLTWPSADLLDSRHELNFGCPGGLAPTHSNRIIQSADLILFLGARLDLLTTGFNPNQFGKRARRIVVDIDPRELGKLSGAPHTYPIEADVRKTIEWLARQHNGSLRHQEWLDSCVRLRDEDIAHQARAFGEGMTLNAPNIANTFSRSLQGTTLVATASGYAIEGFARFFQPTAGNRIIYAGHCLGSMGLGLPTAVGAAAANAGPVICIEGDGGMLLNIQELLTLKANPDINLSIGILNNGGYLSISRSQVRVFKTEYGASVASGLAALDFRQIATTFGFDYVEVTSVPELESVLHAIGTGRPRVIFDIAMGPDEYRGPSIVTRFREDGTPYSSDIEDIEWRTSS